MNKKICISTPVDYSNFGNRLQNYAVHEVCKRMGMEPTTLAVEYAFVLGIIPKNKILELIDGLHLGSLLSKIEKLKSINKSYASWKFTQSEIKTVYIENEVQLDKILAHSLRMIFMESAETRFLRLSGSILSGLRCSRGVMPARRYAFRPASGQSPCLRRI